MNTTATRGEEIPLLHLLPILYRIIGITNTHKNFGITKTQLIVFIILHYRGCATMSEVAQYISASKEQATRTVATLCDNDLVERYEDPSNRTHVYIRFTENGRELMKRLISGFGSEIAEKLSSSLNDEDIEELYRAVQTVIGILGKVK